jgi:hypothetical protein
MPLHPPRMFQGFLLAGLLNKNPAHGLGGRSKEM